ncbi:MAG: DUF1349 domain-containing protein, partial [Chitinophagaceae bacterium]
LRSWQLASTTEGYPNKLRALRVANGVLTMQPYASGWYGDYGAPFLYKNVTGDFDVRARVKVSGISTELPGSEWSLGGLMLRQAPRGGAAEWAPRQENWLFLTTGIAEPKGTPVFEAKSTNNSASNLKLRPARAGWVELRIVRVQATFLLLYRYEGAGWTLLERFYRPLLLPTLQVGFNAYSGWNELPMEAKRDPKAFNTTLLPDVPTDMQLQVDAVRFLPPKLDMKKLGALMQEGFRVPFYTPANVLSDYSITNAEVLAIIGD